MFKDNDHIHVYSPGAGADITLGSDLFQKCNSSVNFVIFCKFYPLNDFVTVFPFIPICVQV